MVNGGKENLYRFGGLILMILGGTICILNLIVFRRKHLRKNPYSIYFVAFNLSNFLFICLPLLFAILSTRYGIEPSAYSLISCRFNIYTAFLFNILSPFYLILASIDRTLITSRNAQTRRRSTCRLAYICIIGGTIFWMLFHSHALVFPNIIQVAPNKFSCYFKSGIYLIFIGVYSLIVTGILIPLILAIFGLLALKNIRAMRRATPAPVLLTAKRPLGHNMFSIQPKDRQLVRMLLIDIINYIFFSAMLLNFLMYLEVTQYQTTSAEQIQLELFVRYVATLIAYIPFSIGGFTNLFVSKTFRSELKKVLLCK
jgi:hypothetical protein